MVHNFIELKLLKLLLIENEKKITPLWVDPDPETLTSGWAENLDFGSRKYSQGCENKFHSLGKILSNFHFISCYVPSIFKGVDMI